MPIDIKELIAVFGGVRSLGLASLLAIVVGGGSFSISAGWIRSIETAKADAFSRIAALEREQHRAESRHSTPGFSAEQGRQLEQFIRSHIDQPWHSTTGLEIARLTEKVARLERDVQALRGER